MMHVFYLHNQTIGVIMKGKKGKRIAKNCLDQDLNPGLNFLQQLLTVGLHSNYGGPPRPSGR
jgi:hypothetical protein